MTRFLLIIGFTGYIAYGAWNGCADSVQNQRAANIERAQVLDAI